MFHRLSSRAGSRRGSRWVGRYPDQLSPQEWHHLAGETLHVSDGQLVRKNPELQHRHQVFEAGDVLHAFDLIDDGLRTADQRGAALDEVVGRLATGARAE